MEKKYYSQLIKLYISISKKVNSLRDRLEFILKDETGDVPGWVLVVLMTTGLVTAIWTIAQPLISSILRNSLDNMNNIR